MPNNSIDLKDSPKENVDDDHSTVTSESESIDYSSNNIYQKTTEIKLLNQGTYGCIFTPEISCDDGKPGSIRYISKIQKHNESVEYELLVSSKVKKIHNYYFYYAVLIKECEAILSSISEREIKKCNILKAIPVNSTKENKYSSTKIRYVGKNTLEKYLKLLYFKTINEISPNTNFSEKSTEELKIKGGGLFNYFSKPNTQSNNLQRPYNEKWSYLGQSVEKKTNTFLQQKNTFTGEPFVLRNKIKHTYNYLLFSLQKLNSNGIVHNDIKENNIMIDDLTKNPIFIDFNLSFLITSLRDSTDAFPKTQTTFLEQGSEKVQQSVFGKPSTYLSSTPEKSPSPSVLGTSGDVSMSILDKKKDNTFIETLTKLFFYSKFYLYYSIDFYILVYIVNEIFLQGGKSTKENFVDLQKINIIIKSFFINLYNKSKQFNFYLFSSNDFLTNLKKNSEQTTEKTDLYNVKREEIEISSAKDGDKDLLLENIIEEIESESPEFGEVKNKFIDYFQKTYQNKTWQELFNDLTETKTIMTWDNYSLAITYIMITTTSISSYLSNPNNNSIFQISLHENPFINLWKEIIFSLPNERMSPIQTIEKLKYF
jgi:hypothetical protein